MEHFNLKTDTQQLITDTLHADNSVHKSKQLSFMVVHKVERSRSGTQNRHYKVLKAEHWPKLTDSVHRDDRLINDI